TDQQADGQVTRRNEVDAVRKHRNLRQIEREAVDRHEHAVRDPAGDGGGEVPFVGILKFLSKVIEAIESDDHFEVAHAFLNFGAHAAKRLEALQVPALYPARNQLREKQHARSGNQRHKAQAHIQCKEKNSGACHHEKVACKLDERLRKKQVELVGI